MKEEEFSVKKSKNGNIIATKDKYGWITRMEYRKSMDDMTIRQYKKGFGDRMVYLKPEDCDLLLELFSKKKENSKQ